MHRFRLLVVPLAILATIALTAPGTAGASGTIVFDGSPGTGAPPATLGPYTMTPFGLDPQPFGDVAGVAGPTGNVTFSPQLDHVRVGDGWNTWSNGYTGDVYWTNGALSASVTLPAGTSAFYLYAEPNPYAVYDVTAFAQDGTTSGPIAVDGFAGAQYFGFYGQGGATIASVSVTSNIDFAIGEFGIGAPSLQTVALPPSGVHVDDSLDPAKPVGAFVDPSSTTGDPSPYTATVDFGAGNGAQAATVRPAGSSCPPSLDTSSGGSCFLVYPSAAAARSPYLQAGDFTLAVAVSEAAGPSGSATASVTVASSTYLVELKAWIPYPLVVDPLNPTPGFLSPTAAVVLGWPTCGAPAGLFVPLPPPVPSPATVVSFLRGDTHAGFAGSYRVDTALRFEWTGTQLVSSQVTPNPAVSNRAIAYSLLGMKSWQCDMSALATMTTTANAAGTSFRVDYSSATPLVPAAPTIDGFVNGSFASDGTISLSFTTDGFPSHGVSIARNGTTQQIDLLNDASCIGQSGVLGLTGLTRVGLGLTGAVTSSGSFTDTPDQSGTGGLDQFPGFPIC
jgi:hypothetical protein